MIHTPFIWPLIFAVVINAGLAIYARRYRGAPAALPFQVLMWLGVAMALLYAGEISYTALPSKVFLSEIRFIPAAALAPTTLVLVLEYLGRAEWLSRPRLLLIYLIPVITALLSLTGSYHNLFRYNFQIHADSPVAGLIFERGAWWLVYYSYTLILCAISCVLLAGSLVMPGSRRQPRGNSLAILLAILFGVTVDLLYVLDLTPVHGYYWTPAAFTLTGWLFGWALFSGHLFDFTPVARNTVLENIDDLVIVLDKQQRIVDFNRAAQAACGFSKAAIGCQPEKALPPEWVAILREPGAGQANSLTYNPPAAGQANNMTYNPPGTGLANSLTYNPPVIRQEVRLTLPGSDGSTPQQRVYELSCSAIQDKRQRQLGYLYLLHDVSGSKQLEEALRQARDELEQRVQERTSDLVETNIMLQQEIDERKHAEEALRENEQRFRIITSNTPDHLVVHDLDLRYLLVVNPQLGLTAEDMLGKTDYDFLQPEEADRLVRAKRQVLETGVPLHFETSLLSRAGNEEFFDGTYVPKFDAQGQADGLIGYFRNVTEQKRIEQSLRASEAKYRQLVETAHEGIVLLDTQRRLTYINPSMEKITGYPSERLIGQSALDYIFAEDLAEQERQLEQRLQGVSERYERKIRHADGHAVWLHVTSSPLTGSDGQIIGSFSMCVDITDRKLAEDSLRESQRKIAEALEFNKSILNTSSVGILTYHESGQCTFANQAAARIAGTDIAGLLAQNFHQIHSWKFNGIYEAALKALDTSHEQRLEAYSLTTFGRNIWTRFVFSSFNDRDEKHLMVFVQDITESKLAEDALSESEERFRKLADTTSTAILVFQGEQFCYVNHACEDIGGYTVEELLSMKLWQLVPPDSQELIRQRGLLRQQGEAVPGRLEVKLLHKDGGIRWLDYTAAPITWNGQPAILGTAFDITERRLAEEAVRQANAYNRSLIEASLDPLVTIGADGKISDANSAAELVTGLARQEFIGTYYSNYFTDQDKAHEAYHKALREGSVSDYELELKHRDGRSTPVLYNASVYRDESGEVRGVFAAARDITRRKQIEAAEREQSRLAEALRDIAIALTSSLNLNQVLDQIIASVGLVVPSDSIAFLLVESREPGNTQVRFARQQGYNLDELGRSLLDVHFTLEQTANLRWMAETRKSLFIPDTRSSPGWIEVPQGVWVRSNLGAPVCIKGETVGFIDLASATPGFFTEEHARRLEALAAQAAIAIENARLYEEMQAARERLQTLSVRLVQVQESERRHLARELHDEIGQALTGLKLSLEAGTGPLVTAGQTAALQTRLRQARAQVSELIARTRELSLELRPAMLDDLGLLPALIWHFERYYDQTGIQVKFQAGELEGRRFPADIETAAYRIVQEALTNVARHAVVKQAAVQVRVEAVSGAVDGSATIDGIADPVYRLYVRVEDRGLGFDLPAVLDSGSAGGLTGMQERAALLGGRLTIDSIPGSGTRLTAVLPL